MGEIQTKCNENIAGSKPKILHYLFLFVCLSFVPCIKLLREKKKKGKQRAKWVYSTLFVNTEFN